MTLPHDTPRQWSRPVEEVARAIYEDRNGHGAVPWVRREARHKAPYERDAQAALARLISLGFINEQCFEALKAEKGEGK